MNNLHQIHAIADELFLSKTEVKLQSNTRLLLRLISQHKNVPPTAPLWLLKDFVKGQMIYCLTLMLIGKPELLV
jgi:hypothetical protein